MELFKKCIAEGIGTFTIVLGGCGAIAADQLSGGSIGHAGIATAFGLIVMSMIYAVGHISGAHFNPAVTLAFASSRHFPVKQIPMYIASQCLGAIIAAAILLITLEPILLAQNADAVLDIGVTQPIEGGGFMTAFVWEILLTFILMFVIMGVATDYRAVGQMAGLAIGGTVWFEAMFAGKICDASMNPARSLGPAMVAGHYTHLIAYIAGPIIGAYLAATLYNFIRCEKDEDCGDDSGEIKGCC